MATVVTTMPSTLLILEVSDFRAFTAHHPELAKAVEREAARRRGTSKQEPLVGAQPAPQIPEDRDEE